MDLWERIHETLGEDSCELGRGFARICSDFERGFTRIHEALGGDSQGFVRL